jgi:hypothetical protein
LKGNFKNRIYIIDKFNAKFTFLNLVSFKKGFIY